MIVVLTGRVCTGKTSLTDKLTRSAGFHVIRTRDLISRKFGPMAKQERRHLQSLGEQLDEDTSGCWTRDALSQFYRVAGNGARVVLDSPRSLVQILAIRSKFGNEVFHIHLDASVDTLEKRYLARTRDGFDELPTYGKVQENATEAQVDDLGEVADLRVHTDNQTIEEVFLNVVSFLSLREPSWVSTPNP